MSIFSRRSAKPLSCPHHVCFSIGGGLWWSSCAELLKGALPPPYPSRGGSVVGVWVPQHVNIQTLPTTLTVWRSASRGTNLLEILCFGRFEPPPKFFKPAQALGVALSKGLGHGRCLGPNGPSTAQLHPPTPLGLSLIPECLWHASRPGTHYRRGRT